MSSTSPIAQVLWLFGPACAGKTTLARGLAEMFDARGLKVLVIDEEELASGLNADLEGKPNASTEGARRMAHSVRLMAKADQLVVAAARCPMRADRDAVKSVFQGVPMKLVFVSCLAEVSKERAKELGHKVGKSFEQPENADLVLKTHLLRPEECVNQLARLVPTRVGAPSSPLVAPVAAAAEPDAASATPNPGVPPKVGFLRDWNELRGISRIRAKNEVNIPKAPRKPRPPPPGVLPFWMKYRPSKAFNIAFLVLGMGLLGYLIDRVRTNYESARKRNSEVRKEIKQERAVQASLRGFPSPGLPPQFVSPAGTIDPSSPTEIGMPKPPAGEPRALPPAPLPGADAKKNAPLPAMVAAPKSVAEGMMIMRPRPSNAEKIEADGQTLMAAYWGATNWKDKLQHVRDAPRVEKLMEAYYRSNEGLDTPGTKFIGAKYFSLGQCHFVALTYRGSRGNTLAGVVLEEEATGELKLDWESLVGAGDMTWEDLQSKRPTQPVLLRVTISPADYYNFEFTDETTLLCVRLVAPGGDRRIFAFAPRRSDLGILADSMARLGPGLEKMITVKVAYPPNAQSDHAVHLLEIVADRWLLR